MKPKIFVFIVWENIANLKFSFPFIFILFKIIIVINQNNYDEGKNNGRSANLSI